MKLLVSFLLSFLACLPLSQAQRIRGLSDSTVHVVAPGDTVVAGRYKLYRLQQGQLQPFYNMYDPADTARFIRDFDAWNAQHFYVVLGSGYFGGATLPLKSLNGGLSWEEDTALVAKRLKQNVPEASLNALQTYGDSTMYAFDGYYESAVIISHNRGRTWQPWFDALIVHWFGFMICPDGRHYLMSRNGDGFGAHLYRVPDSLFGQTGVHFFPPFAERLLILSGHPYFEPYMLSKKDSLCNLPAEVVDVQQSAEGIRLYPNPATGGTVSVSLSNAASTIDMLEVLDATGRVVLRQEPQRNAATVSLAHLPAAFYMLRMRSGAQLFMSKVVARQ